MDGNSHKSGIKRLGITVVGVALVAVIVAYSFWFSEPRWQGRRLSSWLGDMRPGRPEEQQRQAEAAIQAIGINGIPTLLRLMRAEDSSLKRFIHEMEPNSRKSRFPRTQFHWAYEDWANATQGFDILGPAAAAAVPEIVGYLAEDQRGRYAALSLAAIGTPALPALTNVLLQQTTAYSAALALTGSGDEGVAVLLTALTHTNHIVRIGATTALRFLLSYSARQMSVTGGRWDRLASRIDQYESFVVQTAAGFHAGREKNLIRLTLDQYATNTSPNVAATARSVRQRLGL